MVNSSDAFLFLLEVDKELADDLGEDSLASEITAAAATAQRSNRMRAITAKTRPFTDHLWTVAAQSPSTLFAPFRNDSLPEVEDVEAAHPEFEAAYPEFEVPDLLFSDDRPTNESARRRPTD
ncbi:hypothetical protein [Microbacterium maritypicum]|uniref:hypothetical protein n=1 Tax=Microbacterium maritypicum TaxID=33918 RepID=UPI0038264F0E